MKIICPTLFLALLVAHCISLGALGLARPGSQPAPGPQISTGQDERAEEWRERRRQKRQQSTPQKTSGVVKALIKMEKGEIIRQIKAIRWNDFYPKFGQISTNSGQGGGVRYYKSKIAGSGLALESSAAISFTRYRLADLHFGRFNQIAPNTLR